MDVALRAFLEKSVYEYLITRLKIIFAQMPSREDTVNVVRQVNMVPVFSVMNANYFPFDCDFLPDEWLAFARKVMRMELSGRLPVVHLPTLAASASQTSDDKHC